MPATTPALSDILLTRLTVLGERIRVQRKRLKLSATVTAEAAGLSRVTLHRIERGEPSVTLGAYFSVLSALGLHMEIRDPLDRSDAAPLPASIDLERYPQLRRLAWQRGATVVTPDEALSLYERNWRHLDPTALEPAERALLQTLIDGLSGGRPLV